MIGDRENFLFVDQCVARYGRCLKVLVTEPGALQESSRDFGRILKFANWDSRAAEAYPNGLGWRMEA